MAQPNPFYSSHDDKLNSPDPLLSSGSPRPYPGSPALSREPSSSSKASGAPMLLYRLEDASSIRGNRFSAQSGVSDHSMLDDKYPSLRSEASSSNLSAAAAAAGAKQRNPHAFLNTPQSTNVPLAKSAPRGIVAYEYDPVADSMMPDVEEDMLHDPKYSKDQTRAKNGGGSRGALTVRGFTNLGALFVLVAGMLALFLVYPLINHLQMTTYRKTIAENVHVNGTGQVPDLALIREPVDKDTPQAARTRTGFDGQKYTLVYSDEFNEPGRTFFPGDDPYLEAMDFWYGVTGDMEYYDPRQVVTRDGALVITMDSADTTQPLLTPNSTAPFLAKDNHNFKFRSGMLQSWNKLCFTGGYIEVAVTLPGAHTQVGYWPGAWTMGNLGRPGYRATTDAMWPYSYDECDVGTFPNQTEKDQSGPVNALPQEQRGWAQYDYKLSVLNGQRLSACTCPNSDHPGPFDKFKGDSTARYRGRGVPEIDILEVQNGGDALGPGSVASQSVQFAPFTHDWNIDEAGQTLFNPENSQINGYHGSPLQQAVSALSKVPFDGHQLSPNKRFVTYGFEYWADPDNRDDGFITWQVDGKQTVKTTPAAVRPDKGAEGSQVGQRLVPEEPLNIILNLGISQNWGAMDFDTLVFPAEMTFDYIRIYQREGHINLGCDPKDYPTKDYINKHIDQYSDWETKSKWEKGTPKNRLYDGC